MELLLSYLKDSLPNFLDFAVEVIIAVIVLLVGRKIIKFLRKFVKKFLDKTTWEEGVKQFIDNAANVAMYVILILLILGEFGITAASVIAVVGSAGLSIGLALQGSLSNFAGGILILILKPFKVGDYIIEDTHGNQGTVTEIQLFYTTLLTIDNQTVVLPNGDLANTSLTNITEQENRRVDIIFGISYNADIKEAKAVIEKVILEEPCRLADQPYNVYVDSLGESAVNIGIRVWVASADYFPAKWRMTENIKYALDENGIEIPFAQLSVTMVNDEQTKKV